MGGNAGLAPPRSEAIAASNHDPEFTCAAFDAVRDASLAREVGCHELAQYTVTRWLADGEVIPLGDNADEGSLRVIHVPGHTPDSLALWLLPERICFVGDSLYPHASVIVSNRDSSLAQYVASLQVNHKCHGCSGCTLRVQQLLWVLRVFRLHRVLSGRPVLWPSCYGPPAATGARELPS